MEDKKLVVFSINRQEYGIPGEYVQSIEKMQPITRVPFTKPFIKGVFNLRGVVIPVLSLNQILSAETSVVLDEQKIIIIRYKDIEAGLIIDEANDVLTINEELIQPMDEKFESSRLFSGVLKLDTRLITILNIERSLYPDGKEE